jgi:hypothetical protein
MAQSVRNSWILRVSQHSYRNMDCDYRDGVNIIRSKLYNDKCEVEVHLLGSFKDVHEYSAVRHNP